MNSSDERGFTLLEVLVALVILLLSLGAFYQSFGIGLLAEEAAQRKQRATEIAANMLAGLGRSQALQDGVTSGELPDGYRWTLRIEPFIPADEPERAAVTGHVATIEVQVAKQTGTTIHLQTLVLGAGGP